MTAGKASLDHIFGTIRREFTDEFPDLALYFVLFEEGQHEKALAAKKQDFETHPAGPSLVQMIEETLQNPPAGNFCVGLAEHTEKSLWGLRKKTSFIGACFVQLTDTKLFEDINFSCRKAGYAIAFEGLNLYLEKTKRKKPRKQTPDDDPQKQKVESLRLKLMGDCFAAMLLESTGIKGAIQTVTKKFCELSIEPSLHFRSEHHPMPIALDGLNVVYKDLKDDIAPKTGLLAHTHFMAQEIGHTYDDLNIRQWIRFCISAQEMAWAGHSSNEILSAAVYGSDNPYIRSTAHICAESLNTTPVPLKSGDIYNPFTDEETNERVHLRSCRMTLRALLEDVNETKNPQVFLDKARDQTHKLFNNHPQGWCAPALIEAENAYRLFQEKKYSEQDVIENAFHGACAMVKWRDLQRLNRKFVAQRRMGHDITAELALSLIKDDEAFTSYKNAFEIMRI